MYIKFCYYILLLMYIFYLHNSSKGTSNIPPKYPLNLFKLDRCFFPLLVRCWPSFVNKFHFCFTVYTAQWKRVCVLDGLDNFCGHITGRRNLGSGALPYLCVQRWFINGLFGKSSNVFLSLVPKKLLQESVSRHPSFPSPPSMPHDPNVVGDSAPPDGTPPLTSDTAPGMNSKHWSWISSY